MQTIIFSKGKTVDRENKALKLISELIGNHISHPDMHTIEVEDGKQIISIEKARELIKIASVKPRNSKYKVIWIKEAHTLSIEAQNSLLKIIEEPPEYAQIILTVDHHQNLIDTIRSRCLLREISNEIESSIIAKENQTEKAKIFLDILNMNMGERIDWVIDNKNELTDRKTASELTEIWITILRDLMIWSEHNHEGSEVIKVFNESLIEKLKIVAKSKRPAYWAEKIRIAEKINNGIKKYKANISLAIDALLVNI